MRTPGALDDPAGSRAWEVRRARLDRLTGHHDRAGERLGAVEPLMPQDALPPDRVIFLLERATLSESAVDRAACLDRLTEAEEQTGVRLAPWESARRSELAHPV